MKKTLLALLLLVAVLLSGCEESPGEPGGYVSPAEDSGHEKSAPSVEATPTPEPTPTTGIGFDYFTAYEPLIAEWKECLSRHKNGEDTADDMFSFWFYIGYNTDVKAYYALYDIDGNGIPELILRKKQWYDENRGEDIIAYIFTLKDGVPVNLFGYDDVYGKLREVPWSRRGASEILSNGLIDSTGGSIYKIADDGYSLLNIAYSEPYDYPNEAGLAFAKWRYYINGIEVDYNFYVKYLSEQGYNIDRSNALAPIEWIEVN